LNDIHLTLIWAKFVTDDFYHIISFECDSQDNVKSHYHTPNNQNFRKIWKIMSFFHETFLMENGPWEMSKKTFWAQKLGEKHFFPKNLKTQEFLCWSRN